MKLRVVNGTGLLALAALVSTPVLAQTTLETVEQKAGYSIGANIGFNLASQGLTQDLDLDALLDGVRDGVSGELELTEDEIMTVLQEFSLTQQAKAQAAQDAMAQAGRDFLTANGTKAGVTTTVTGLQYEVISAATDAAAAMPAVTDTVEVHYHGTLADGTVFDSSVDRGEPISFPLDSVIPGWTEGLQLMKVGDKFRFFIPPELGYGPNPAGPIPGNSVLVFEVELLAIETPSAQ